MKKQFLAICMVFLYSNVGLASRGQFFFLNKGTCKRKVKEERAANSLVETLADLKKLRAGLKIDESTIDKQIEIVSKLEAAINSYLSGNNRNRLRKQLLQKIKHQDELYYNRILSYETMIFYGVEYCCYNQQWVRDRIIEKVSDIRFARAEQNIIQVIKAMGCKEKID